MWGGRYRQGTSVEKRERRLRDCKIKCALEGTVMDQPGYRRTSNLKITRARLEQNVFLTLTLGMPSICIQLVFEVILTCIDKVFIRSLD